MHHERLCQLYQTIFTIEQLDKHSHINYIVVEQKSKTCTKFNRGLLLNIGSLYAHDHAKRRKVSSDGIVIVHHDVDMCPVSTRRKGTPACNIYNAYNSIPPRGKVIPLGQLWRDCPYYRNFDKFLGGVVVMSWKTLYAANGYPNNYWGWGGEEECFRFRLGCVLSAEGDIYLRPDELFDARADEYIYDLESVNIPYDVKDGKFNIKYVDLSLCIDSVSYGINDTNIIPRPPRSEKNMKKWELEKEWSRDFRVRINGLDDCRKSHNIYKLRPDDLPNKFMESMAVSGKLIWIVTVVTS